MFGKKKKSLAKSGEYGACGTNSNIAIHIILRLQLKKCERVHCHDETAFFLCQMRMFGLNSINSIDPIMLHTLH